MSPQELADACHAAITAQGAHGTPRHKAQILLATPPGWKPAPGFPRGVIIQQKPDGTRLRYIPAAKILDHIDAALLELPTEGEA